MRPMRYLPCSVGLGPVRRYLLSRTLIIVWWIAEKHKSFCVSPFFFVALRLCVRSKRTRIRDGWLSASHWATAWRPLRKAR